MGGGRQVPAPPPNSESDPTLQFGNTTQDTPSSSGYGCYIAPGLKVGTALDARYANCDPGWYCPNVIPGNETTLPSYCPPSGGCASYRLSSLPCTAQGLYEPAVCKPGFYCPNIHTMLPCPASYYCPTGTVTPRPCGILTLCPQGSVTQVPYGPLVLMVILDGALAIVILIAKIRQGLWRRWGGLGVLERVFGGPGYALKERARSQMEDLGKRVEEEKGMQAAAMPGNGLPAANTEELRKLVAAFHSALGHRELRMNFKFDNLSLSLKSGKKVLEGVTGEIRSKRMTAIIGPSGAGKTTFMNVLMGKVARTGGRLYINGAEAEIHLYRKIIGYVPQEDIMLRELTVREVVLHSARVRLPRSWSTKQIEDHVDNVLKALNLSHVANSFIGDETTRGVSGGQRKRVNIGMELAAAPLAIFLDEPTSGLDSTAALEVADILQNIAHLGLTIVSVIHQPRIEIFKKFDDVLMIAPGGKVAFLGPIAQAQRYFESLGFDFDPATNMSDVLMDILSGKAQNNRYAFGPQQLVAAWENRKVRDYLLEYPLADGDQGSIADTSSAAGVPLSPLMINTGRAESTRGSFSGVGGGLTMSPPTVVPRRVSEDEMGGWLVSVNGDQVPIPPPHDDDAADHLAMARHSINNIRQYHGTIDRDGASSINSVQLEDSILPASIKASHRYSSGSMSRVVPRALGGVETLDSPSAPPRGVSRPLVTLGGAETPETPSTAVAFVTPDTASGYNILPTRGATSHATLAASIVESLSRGTPLGGAPGSSSDEDTRMLDIEFHRLAPQVVRERGASFARQLWYCHFRALTQQSRATGALVLEIFVAMFAGFLMGISTQGKVKELFNGTYAGIYVLLSPAPLDLLSLYGLLIGIGIALAGAPSGVKVFGEEKPIFWREAGSGHNKAAYYIGKTVSAIYRLILTSLHFTGMYAILAKPVINIYTQYMLIFLQFWGVYGMSCIISLVVRRENASLLSVVVGLFAAVFCGYGPNLVQARKWGMLWLFELSFNKWAAEAQYATSTAVYVGIYDVELMAGIWGYSLDQVTRDFLMAFILGIVSRAIGYVLLISLHRDKQR